jgi:predicted dehydrogenase
MTHDHVWSLARQWSELDVELVSAADPYKPLRDRITDAFDVPRTYSEYGEMLAAEDLDVLTVCLDNAHHADVVEAAADAGVHCLVEKPMAATLRQAERMLEAAQTSDIKLMVNWPTNWMPIYREAARMAAAGDLGRIYQVKHKGGHAGPKAIGCSEYFYGWLYDSDLNGAGAYMDYSGYGANIVYEYLGMPAAVYAGTANLVQDFHSVDDNSVLLMRYERAMALVEASWTQIGNVPGTTQIAGETGTLVADYHAGNLLLYDQTNADGRILKTPPLPKGDRNAPEYLLRCVTSDEPVAGPSNPLRCRNIQEILQAGLFSMAEHREVALPL